MHVYNAVLVLKEIIDVFPIAAVNEVVGSSIDLEIQRLTQAEERGDLKILARSYVSDYTICHVHDANATLHQIFFYS